MAISFRQPKSINLLDPVYSPTDAFSKAYIRLVNVGKYLLIIVELVVLAVFFSRFILDKQNNDLTEEINSQVGLLSDGTWRKNGTLYSNYQSVFRDIEIVRTGQKISSNIISEIVSGIPITLNLRSFSLRESRVSLSLMAINLEDVKIYESALKANERYKDVNFNISKDEFEIIVGITFNLNTETI